MYTLTYRTSFDAAHKLVGHPGRCQNLHGHTWYVDVEVQSKILDKLGMVIDFETLQKYLNDILPDHAYLNESLALSQPTAEKIAQWVYERLDPMLNGQLKSVTIWESPHSGVRYEPEAS